MSMTSTWRRAPPMRGSDSPRSEASPQCCCEHPDLLPISSRGPEHQCLDFDDLTKELPCQRRPCVCRPCSCEPFARIQPTRSCRATGYWSGPATSAASLPGSTPGCPWGCLLYTSDAADDLLCVD